MAFAGIWFDDWSVNLALVKGDGDPYPFSFLSFFGHFLIWLFFPLSPLD